MNPSTGPRASHARLWLALAAAALLLGACSSTSSPDASTTRKASGATGDAERAAPEQPSAVADGLETLLWVADDTGGAIGRKLAPYLANTPPMDEASAERLRALGLRAVAVPLKELDALRASLEAAGPTQRRWLGQLPDWTVLVEGNNYPGGLRATVGSRKAELEPGRLRWLVRAWTTPVTRMEDGEARIAAALHVELVPQMEAARPTFERMLEQAARDGSLTLRAAGPEREGPLVEDAIVKLELATTDVLVLAPESPDVDWLAEIEPSDQAGRTAPTPGGPATPRTTTIGEAMLAQDTAAGGRIKVVVALIPRLPDRFRLIGR
jgi:hypothetical protein